MKRGHEAGGSDGNDRTGACRDPYIFATAEGNGETRNRPCPGATREEGSKSARKRHRRGLAHGLR